MAGCLNITLYFDGPTIDILLLCLFSRAVKRLIAINRIQSKSLCLHNICGCTLYTYFIYLEYTHMLVYI